MGNTTRMAGGICKMNGLNKEGKNEPVTSSQLIKLSCRESWWFQSRNVSDTPWRWKLILPGFFPMPGEALRPSCRAPGLNLCIALAWKVNHGWWNLLTGLMGGVTDTLQVSARMRRDTTGRMVPQMQNWRRIFKHGNGDGTSKKWQMHKTDYAKLFGPKKLHKNLK